MTHHTPVATSPHNSSPAFALRYGRPLPGLLTDDLAFVLPIAPDWAIWAMEGGE